MSDQPTELQQLQDIRLVSKAPYRRPAFWWTAIALLSTIVMAILLIASSTIAIVQHSHLNNTAVVFLGIGVALVVFAFWFAYDMVRAYASAYVLDLNDSGVTLYVDNKLSHRQLRADMAWNDVDYVEYFTPLDSSSLIFHGIDRRIIEVPLWDLTSNPEPVLWYMGRKNIKVLRMP